METRPPPSANNKINMKSHDFVYPAYCCISRGNKGIRLSNFWNGGTTSHLSQTITAKTGTDRLFLHRRVLEVIFNEMRYINLRFTYLLTYLLT